VVHPGWAVTVTGGDHVTPRLQTRTVPTLHATDWLVGAARKCTVTLTGHSVPGVHVPAPSIATPVIGPACRGPSDGTTTG
jgi:hypothetical protein